VSNPVSGPNGVRWRVAWITGASTGIGRSIALLLASRGVTVAISARTAATLAEVATLNSNIRAYPVDVTDRAAQAEVIGRIERELGPIDLAILNAGVWHPMSSNSFDVPKIEQSLAVNYLAAVYALESLLPAMSARRKGHIALVSSVAGYMGLPQAIAYAPGKAAMISLAEALRTDVARFDIDCSLINPGFVDTPMTKSNTFPMPFIVSADRAAAAIVRGLERKRFEIAFPWQLVTILRLVRLLPYPLRFWLQTRGGVQPRET
jgi:short-subunit dehydrogenase